MKTHICSVEGCGRASVCRHMCTKHYQRWKKHGDPQAVEDRIPVGTSYVGTNGYVLRTENGRQEYEHIRLAERALGKPLPVGAVVHHVDENPVNNAPGNLVICPSQAYHMMLHRRARALRECGHANWLRCQFCKQYDAPELISESIRSQYHKACRAAYVRKQTADRNMRTRA